MRAFLRTRTYLNRPANNNMPVMVILMCSRYAIYFHLANIPDSMSLKVSSICTHFDTHKDSLLAICCQVFPKLGAN